MKAALIRKISGALALSGFASPVHAGVCETVRPNWGGAQTGMFGEALNLVFSPGGIVLLIMVVLSVRFRNPWFSAAIAACAGALAFMNYYAWIHPLGIDVEARREGCIGEPELAIAVFILLGLFTLGWQFLGGKRQASS